MNAEDTVYKTGLLMREMLLNYADEAWKPAGLLHLLSVVVSLASLGWGSCFLSY